MTSFQYIISFFLGDVAEEFKQYVYYGNIDSAPASVKIIIIQSDFFDEGVYGTSKTLPKVPLSYLPDSNIPFLFGESKIDCLPDGKLIIYADLIASAYFMLSRYEEIIKPDCRDQYGRFLSKDSVIFQQGYGMRPLVDEWGRYLRNLLRKTNVDFPNENNGFSKIFLTHDIDRPFLIPTFKNSIRHVAKKVLRKETFIKNPLMAYFSNTGDPFYTFPWLVVQDNIVKQKYKKDIVEDIYFIISAKSTNTNKYYPINNRKYKKLLSFLSDNNSSFGLHISHEGGIIPENITSEIALLPKCVNREKLFSRHHYLRWREPEHIEQLEAAGIKEDFSLGYADSVGFRVGTCRPYRFINPKTKQLSNILIHPLEIMECSLFAKQYMNLNYEDAEKIAIDIIEEIKNHNGECVLLFHNSSFFEDNRYEKLYTSLLNVLKNEVVK